MTGQRTWMRVEAPGTFRGHALEARIDGDHFVGWENADGRWSLEVNGARPVPCRDWAEVRRIAERGRARAPNPLDPLTATAAAGGMAFAMRYFLMHNPTECTMGTPFAPAPPYREGDCVWLEDEGGWRYAPANLPGAAGDIALWTGQYDGRRGQYNPEQFKAAFKRKIYDQGYREGQQRAGELTVLCVVKSVWLAKPPRQDRYGNVWLLARPGYRGRVRRATRRARLPFPVQVMEAV